MTLQELINNYGVPVWGVGIQEDEMHFEDVDEGRFAARIATRLLREDVSLGCGLLLIVVPDSVLFPAPVEHWWERLLRWLARRREYAA